MNYTSLKKRICLLLAGVAAVGFGGSALSASAAESITLLSSRLRPSAGTVMSSADYKSAQQTLTNQQAMAEAAENARIIDEQQKREAEQKAAEEQRIAEEQKVAAEKQAEAAAEQQASQPAPEQPAAPAVAEKPAAPPVASPTARPVAYSASHTIDPASGTLLGNYKLSFYCACEICTGKTNGITASGSTLTEGRTIAVDTSVIPLGSHVFIEGFGSFIAEDRGGAIRGNRIDIAVASHDHALALGIKYANVYLVS